MLLIGFIVLFIAIITSSIIQNNARKALDEDKRSAIVELFCTSRWISFGLIALLLMLFLLITGLHLFDPPIALVLFFGLAVVVYVFSAYWSFKKLEENDYPDSYLQAHIIYSVIRFLGLFIFFGLTLTDLYLG